MSNISCLRHSRSSLGGFERSELKWNTGSWLCYTARRSEEPGTLVGASRPMHKALRSQVDPCRVLGLVVERYAGGSSLVSCKN